MNIVEVDRRWEDGRIRGEELIKVEKAKQERERWKKIRDSKSNRKYKFIKGPWLPEYL